MSIFEHGPGEPHVTETWGPRLISVNAIIWTLRMRAGRDDTEEGQRRVVEVVRRWVERYCDRRGLLWEALQVAPVQSKDGGEPATTVVACFLVAAGMPKDWLCFGGTVWDALEAVATPRMMPYQMMLVGDGIIGSPPADDGPKDGASAEVGGRTFTVGEQKRHRH